MVFNKNNAFVKILLVVLFFLIGVLGIVFSFLYLDTFNEGVFKEYSIVLKGLFFALITILTVLTASFYLDEKQLVYKLLFIITTFFTLLCVGLYFLNKSGLLHKFDSIDSFRKYIASFGVWTTVVFALCQFLQVVILPIPSFITVGAGVLLFGPFLSSCLSCVGIILGSLVGFFIGRKFGYKVAKWLVGEKNLEKALKMIKGKDKIILTFMFLFPFFPDDVLCFVAGITTVSASYFVIMIIIVRVVCIFAQSYSFNNSIIPYDTWWGILIWGIFFILTILMTFFIYKYGDKLSNRLKQIKSRKIKRN